MAQKSLNKARLPVYVLQSVFCRAYNSWCPQTNCHSEQSEEASMVFETKGGGPPIEAQGDN
jgi:hypothetical protein